MSTTTATFANAELACKNAGGRLASWTSGEKQVGGRPKLLLLHV
jgi:hypothetical protein